jgi:hypothetical protein
LHECLLVKTVPTTYRRYVLLSITRQEDVVWMMTRPEIDCCK